jgi:hypothetical protein
MRIIPGALVRVDEDLIRSLDLCKLFRRPLGVVEVAVRVKLKGFPLIGLADPAVELVSDV